MKTPLKVIAWFEEIGKADIPIAGGKGANLGELTRAQVPVPPGFVVTADAYFSFLKEERLTDRIRHRLRYLDPRDSRMLQEVAFEIRQMISLAPMPPYMAEEIKQAYQRMQQGLVAVRSSATAEDLPEASFAGQQSTYLNVQGESDVVAAVQNCWASLYEARAIFYRNEHGFDHLKIGIAVVVQRMVQSEVSGVVFTAEPLSSDNDKIIIEAAYGLGEAVVSGELTPDMYLLDKEPLSLLERRIAAQDWQLVRNPHSEDRRHNIKVAIPAAKQNEQKLSDGDILALARVAKTIEDLYKCPQDIEWAKEGGKIYIVQARPITTLKAKQEPTTEIKGVELLHGLPASPGIAVGQTEIVLDPFEIVKLQGGQVLVAEMTTPDFVPAMKRAAAIVTDRGGRTCHAAIIARELGVPCVVGTGNATKVLGEKQLVTVDGFQGRVYQGRVACDTRIEAPAVIRKHLKTATKVYVNLAEPDLASAVAARDVDGVGLLRAEFMIAGIGQHPRYMLEQNRGSEFVDKLAQGVSTFAKAFDPRPVVYRTTDFKTNEYRNLKGGESYEEVEENPMLGYRGCSRYIREPEVFKLEIEALKKVRQSFDNLWVMIPFVRTVEALAHARSILEAEGLTVSDGFKLWMMVEVPSNIILIDRFIDVGLDGISIGSNDLTQLTLGVDRDSTKLADVFDERDEAVLWCLERAISRARRRRITSSICGQAPSEYPELTAKLVKWGITSVSVNPDMIEHARATIAEVEEELGIRPHE
ncbi:MAG: phosphoenolpyruvate synthase [Chloroflexi bacterium RBG_13_53_26]|nr:MAG: phosphoenolpyruvate synthase [Chloroflexi bacterium RBG_13_53_26]